MRDQSPAWPRRETATGSCRGRRTAQFSAWSLQGINPAVRDELGVRLSFDAAERKYWVNANPVYPSVAWEAGFAYGQYVTGLSIGGQPQNTWHTLLQPLQNQKGGTEYFFKGLIPGKELLFTLQRNQRNGPPVKTNAMTTLSHDPLWTLYPCLDGEWCLTTPAGYYKKSRGMGNLQWLTNLSPANKVVVDQSQQLATAKLWEELVFQDQLRNDEKVDKVVQSRTAAPLDKALLNAPVPPDFTFEIAADGGAKTVTAQVSGQMASLTLLVNGYAVQQARQADKISWTIDASKLRQGRNELVAAATDVVDGHRYTFLSKHPLPPPPPQQPARRRLHFVGIGVSEVVAYGKLKDLPCTAADVKAVNEALQNLTGSAGSQFKSGGVFEALTSERSTLKEFETALGKLAAQVEPDDLAFVMLAGHGIAAEKGKGANAEQGGQGFQFLTRDAIEGKAATGVSGELLGQLLGRINCRTVLLLDTCHSGSAPVNEQLANFFIRSAGPLIITACRGDQLAGEVGEHGLFTSAILKGLAGECQARGFDLAAAKRDGALSVGEFYAYVRKRTNQLGSQFNNRQDPMLFPSDSFTDFANFKLRPL